MNKAPIEHEDLKTAIELLGGQKAVADRFEIPYRTIQNWYRGERTPPTYVARMIIEVERSEDEAQEANYKLLTEKLDKEAARKEALKTSEITKDNVLEEYNKLKSQFSEWQQEMQEIRNMWMSAEKEALQWRNRWEEAQKELKETQQKLERWEIAERFTSP